MRDESVIGVVFDPGREKVLLIKRMDVPVFVLPGGGIDPGETPEEAVVREVREETGLSVKIVRKVGEYTPQNRLSRFTHLFECGLLSGDLTTGAETREVAFYPLKALPKPLPAPFLFWIDDACLNHPGLIRKQIEGTGYFQLMKQLFFHPVLVLRFFLARLGIPLNH